MKAINLNMTEYLFHSINPYNILTEYPENLTLEQIRMEKCCQIVKNILEIGYILPRCELKKILSEKQYSSLISNRTNWNGDNRVSITVHPNNKVIKANGFFSYGTDAYEDYTLFLPTLILNSSVLNNLPIYVKPNHSMIGEIQIEGRIPTSYIVGISLPDPNIFEQSLNNAIDCIDNPSKYQTDYSVHKMIERLQSLSEAEFLNKYYYEVIYFERMLKEINSDLKLYHTDTGYPIKSSKEQVKLIRKIKSQI